ncbi:hypothetical protein GCK72_004518 [Caenorhabditis remanei]|uniref:Uncharacterized protein n=1 Tax=Caenorhabditis remanei TaxID=31234 RepID=A0A6A5HC15_CAERE|nr:hypothetical protein GCK72_004518 [Caenorhabditis remanei]KAF1764569.1 hypothetical protein GCK72_004518 [Caenorhabditis remanei]
MSDADSKIMKKLLRNSYYDLMEKSVLSSDDAAEAIAEHCVYYADKCDKAAQAVYDYCVKMKRINCDTLIPEGLEKHCKDHPGSPPCTWSIPTSTLSTTTTTTTPSTTTNHISTSASNIPLIIGVVIATSVVFAIGITLFFCCRKRKDPSYGGGSKGTTQTAVVSRKTKKGTTTETTGTRTTEKSKTGKKAKKGKKTKKTTTTASSGY